MASLDHLERWFVDRGLPHFVERHDRAPDIWGRAVPLLVPAYLLLGLNALQLGEWSVGRNLLVAAFVVVALLLTWVAANLLRRRRPLERPRRVGPAELAVFVLAPAVPSAVFAQWDDAAETVGAAVLLLVTVWGVTSYGVFPLFRWAGRRAAGQLALLFDLVFRAMPLLLLFTTFLFINAEVWQVAGTLHGLAYVAVIGIFAVFGLLFLLSRVPGLLGEVNRFESWDEVSRLVADTPAAPDAAGWSAGGGRPPHDHPSMRQRFNIGLFAVFSQSIQITLVAGALTLFFILFGVLAIPETTIAAWTQADVEVLARAHLTGRELVLSEPLIRVAGFLGAFTAMYFAVQLSTDAAYREEFAEDVTPQLRRALAVRCVYRAELQRAASAAGGR